MKVLLDACVWSGARTTLEQAGHVVEWAGDWDEVPGDEEILKQAHAAGQIRSWSPSTRTLESWL